ncbi:MAG TPA: carboxypeptidase-like regulatory domain-containing protein [Micropepsaceae bacterium]|nr:carboxypeptidase-like regulatory domain-containing protein [Micropepsaceae bacterium]
MTAKFLLGTILAASVAAGAPAFANGGDFFEELSSSWNQNRSDDGVPYFGFVRDSKGKTIANATIMATTPSGSSFVVQGDAMGHYRIPGFSKRVDAKKVQITCSKVGYKLVARDRRLLRGAPNAPVETNCILAPDVSKPAA